MTYAKYTEEQRNNDEMFNESLDDARQDMGAYEEFDQQEGADCSE
jgi:hypothetical protein